VLLRPVEPRQFTSLRFTERLEEIGARPCIKTVADSFNNALAETINGLYKAECVFGPDAAGFDNVSHLELATLSWVHWFNSERLQSDLGDLPQQSSKPCSTLPSRPTTPRLEPKAESHHQTQGGSLDAFHREWAQAELYTRGLKEGAGMEHCPSDSCFANAAWLFYAVLAHNLLRWTQLLGGLHDRDYHRRAVTWTIRTRLASLPGRLDNRSGTPMLRTPSDWPWQGPFTCAVWDPRALALAVT